MEVDDDLLSAAEVLLQAQYFYRDGRLDVTARLADDAVELVLKTFFPLPETLRPRPGREIPATRQYAYRRAEAERRFNIPKNDLRKLHDLRLVDRFRESRDGSRRILTEAESRWALETADRVLRTVLESPEVDASTRRRVRAQLSLQEQPSPREDLLDVVERQVGWGHYDPGLHSRLERLEMQFENPRSRVGVAHLGRVITLRAHTAMNTGKPVGERGAINLAKRASPIWNDQQNRDRMVHVLKIQSIALRELKQADQCGPLMDEAMKIAADRRDLIDSVNSERASILLDIGEYASAVELLTRLSSKVTSGNEHGVQVQKLGRALMLAGDLVQAEMTLMKAQELLPPDYLMARCVGANTLAELYARWGDKVEAIRWATISRHIITHKGFAHQGRVLDEIERKYPKIW